MTASIVPNAIPITRVSNWNGADHIFIDLPDGWATLKPLTKKVLQFDGRTFTFFAWNSDRNEAWFRETKNVATVKRK